MDDCFKTKTKKPLGLRNNAQADFMCALPRKLKGLSTNLSQLLLRRSTTFFSLFFNFFFSFLFFFFFHSLFFLVGNVNDLSHPRLYF